MIKWRKILIILITKILKKNNIEFFKKVLIKDNKNLNNKISDDNILYFSEDLNKIKITLKNKDINYYNNIYNYLISK